ncbi:MAG: hypothetical protein Q8S36_03945 [Sulfuricurvum sp.]|nr:hypothetical protein [Sulfuricurvum sp.]
MSEQARILSEINTIIMNILKTGSASVEEADKIEELEVLLHQQKCFKELENSEHANQGEEIATLFFKDQYTEAINKMCECDITPDDFFAFADYYYDDEHDDEELAEMFTGVFAKGVSEAYAAKCKA